MFANLTFLELEVIQRIFEKLYTHFANTDFNKTQNPGDEPSADLFFASIRLYEHKCTHMTRDGNDLIGFRQPKTRFEWK